MENTQSHNHGSKIDEALDLLNQAAKDKKEDFQRSLNEKYTHLRDAFASVTAHNADTVRQWKKTAEQFMRDGTEDISHKASQINQRVHESPWPYIAGATAGALVLGFVLGNSKK